MVRECEDSEFNPDEHIRRIVLRFWHDQPESWISFVMLDISLVEDRPTSLFKERRSAALR